MYLSPTRLRKDLILFFKDLFLANIHGCFASMYICMYIRTMCKQCPWKPEEKALESLELELQPF